MQLSFSIVLVTMTAVMHTSKLPTSAALNQF